MCGARIKAPTALSLPPTTSAAPAAAAALESLCDQLRTSHAALCPWASNASPATLGALLLPSRQHEGVPSLQQGHALAKQHLRDRLSGLLSLPSLPALAPSAAEVVAACAALCGLQDEAALLCSLALLLDLPPDMLEPGLELAEAEVDTLPADWCGLHPLAPLHTPHTRLCTPAHTRIHPHPPLTSPTTPAPTAPLTPPYTPLGTTSSQAWRLSCRSPQLRGSKVVRGSSRAIAESDPKPAG